MCLDQDHQRVASNVIAPFGRAMLAVAVIWLGHSKQSLAEPVWKDAFSAVEAHSRAELVQGAAPKHELSLEIDSEAKPPDAELVDPTWSFDDPKLVLDAPSQAETDRQSLQQALLREAALFRDQELLRRERDSQLLAQRDVAIAPSPSGPADHPLVVHWDADRSEISRLAALLQFVKDNRALLLSLTLGIWLAVGLRRGRAAGRRFARAMGGRRKRKRIKVRIRRRIRVRQQRGIRQASSVGRPSQS